MSLEFIRNNIYEKPSKDTNMMIELNTKNETFEFVKSIIIKSKGKWQLVNFDLMLYKYLIQVKEDKVNSITHYFIWTREAFERFKLILKEKTQLIFIGLDLLPKEFLEKILFELSHLKIESILFIRSQHSNEKLRKMSNFLIMCTKSIKYKTSLLNKIELLSFNKGTKEVIIFEYETNNNKIYSFSQISFYSNEYKDLFEPKLKIINHDASFNLKISEEELKSKNGINLPFIKTEEEKKKENLIEIEQEDIDEFFEEDPDEDLDI